MLFPLSPLSLYEFEYPRWAQSDSVVAAAWHRLSAPAWMRRIRQWPCIAMWNRSGAFDRYNGGAVEHGFELEVANGIVVGAFNNPVGSVAADCEEVNDHVARMPRPQDKDGNQIWLSAELDLVSSHDHCVGITTSAGSADAASSESECAKGLNSLFYYYASRPFEWANKVKWSRPAYVAHFAAWRASSERPRHPTDEDPAAASPQRHAEVDGGLALSRHPHRDVMKNLGAVFAFSRGAGAVSDSTSISRPTRSSSCPLSARQQSADAGYQLTAGRDPIHWYPKHQRTVAGFWHAMMAGDGYPNWASLEYRPVAENTFGWYNEESILRQYEYMRGRSFIEFDNQFVDANPAAMHQPVATSVAPSLPVRGLSASSLPPPSCAPPDYYSDLLVARCMDLCPQWVEHRAAGCPCDFGLSTDTFGSCSSATATEEAGGQLRYTDAGRRTRLSALRTEHLQDAVLGDKFREAVSSMWSHLEEEEVAYEPTTQRWLTAEPTLIEEQRRVRSEYNQAMVESAPFNMTIAILERDHREMSIRMQPRSAALAAAVAPSPSPPAAEPRLVDLVGLTHLGRRFAVVGDRILRLVVAQRTRRVLFAFMVLITTSDASQYEKKDAIGTPPRKAAAKLASSWSTDHADVPILTPIDYTLLALESIEEREAEEKDELEEEESIVIQETPSPSQVASSGTSPCSDAASSASRINTHIDVDIAASSPLQSPFAIFNSLPTPMSDVDASDRSISPLRRDRCRSFQHGEVQHREHFHLLPIGREWESDEKLERKRTKTTRKRRRASSQAKRSFKRKLEIRPSVVVDGENVDDEDDSGDDDTASQGSRLEISDDQCVSFKIVVEDE